MYACVSWASSVKTYTLVHVLQLFSLMKPSSMNQKKRWAKDWAFFWKMNGRFVVRDLHYIPLHYTTLECTEGRNTDAQHAAKILFLWSQYHSETISRQNKQNIKRKCAWKLYKELRVCRSEDHQRLCNRNSAETPYTPIQHSQRCERT